MQVWVQVKLQINRFRVSRCLAWSKLKQIYRTYTWLYIKINNQQNETFLCLFTFYKKIWFCKCTVLLWSLSAYEREKLSFHWSGLGHAAGQGLPSNLWGDAICQTRLLVGNNMEERAWLSYMSRPPMARANSAPYRSQNENESEGEVMSMLINATLQ